MEGSEGMECFHVKKEEPRGQEKKGKVVRITHRAAHYGSVVESLFSISASHSRGWDGERGGFALLFIHEF